MNYGRCTASGTPDITAFLWLLCLQKWAGRSVNFENTEACLELLTFYGIPTFQRMGVPCYIAVVLMTIPNCYWNQRKTYLSKTCLGYWKKINNHEGIQMETCACCQWDSYTVYWWNKEVCWYLPALPFLASVVQFCVFCSPVPYTVFKDTESSCITLSFLELCCSDLIVLDLLFP